MHPAPKLSLPFGLTVCGIEELEGHCQLGASHILSILDPDWPVPEAFGAFGEHHKLELRFHDVIDPLPGMLPPTEEHVSQLLEFGRTLGSGKDTARHLLVHCHAGVSRSTASMALILAQALRDVPAAAILAEIVRIRPQAWPNLRVIEIGDDLLDRGGDLITAVSELYRRRLREQPDLAEGLQQGGRGREVRIANVETPPPA